MNKKIIIKITDMSSESCPDLVFSVDMMAGNYGGASPCSNAEDVKRAIKHFKDWAIREGDTPIVKDYRQKAKLSAFW